MTPNFSHKFPPDAAEAATTEAVDEVPLPTHHRGKTAEIVFTSSWKPKANHL